MDKDTLLLRQIHPGWVQADSVSALAIIPTVQNFQPSRNDEGGLSTYNSEKYTPQAAFDHFIGEGYKTTGVMGLTLEECTDASLACSENNYPFDGHCIIDFNVIEKEKWKDTSRKIYRLALSRNWLYKK